MDRLWWIVEAAPLVVIVHGTLQGARYDKPIPWLFKRKRSSEDNQ